MGVSSLELWPDLAEALELPVTKGLLVETVAPDGPAAKVGLHGGNRQVVARLQRLIIGGDVIVALDGVDVANQNDLNIALNHKRPGDTIRVTYYRAGKKTDVTVILTEQPKTTGGDLKR
jgi:S1-C subfamily serine protease